MYSRGITEIKKLEGKLKRDARRVDFSIHRAGNLNRKSLIAQFIYYCSVIIY